MYRIAIQTEELRAGDVIPNFYDNKDARVKRTKRQFGTAVYVEVEPVVKGDFMPSIRNYKLNRTISVLREE